MVMPSVLEEEPPWEQEKEMQELQRLQTEQQKQDPVGQSSQRA
jgi:hypothetical protein